MLSRDATVAIEATSRRKRQSSWSAVNRVAENTSAAVPAVTTAIRKGLK